VTVLHVLRTNNVLYSIGATVYRLISGGHLKAVHEAVRSEIAAYFRSGREPAAGKRNLIG
jgi:hypothetical protein